MSNEIMQAIMQWGAVGALAVVTVIAVRGALEKRKNGNGVTPLDCLKARTELKDSLEQKITDRFDTFEGKLDTALAEFRNNPSDSG
jgi:hypothetical protein